MIVGAAVAVGATVIVAVGAIVAGCGAQEVKKVVIKSRANNWFSCCFIFLLSKRMGQIIVFATFYVFSNHSGNLIIVRFTVDFRIKS